MAVHQTQEQFGTLVHRPCKLPGCKPKGAEQWRSFKLDRVKRVHYKNQTVENLAIEHKEKMKAKKAEIDDGTDQGEGLRQLQSN